MENVPEKRVRQRTEDRSRFIKVDIDDEIIASLKKCQKNAACTALEVSKEYGCSQSHAKSTLLRLAKEGRILGIKKGQAHAFKPLPEEDGDS